MRFTHGPKPVDGDIRVKSGFLLFPKRIGNETRWLEYAAWKEKFKYIGFHFLDARGMWGWVAIRWLSVVPTSSTINDFVVHLPWCSPPFPPSVPAVKKEDDNNNKNTVIQ